MLDRYNISYNMAYHTFVNGYTVYVYAEGRLIDILQKGNDTRKKAQFHFMIYLIYTVIWYGKISFYIPD